MIKDCKRFSWLLYIYLGVLIFPLANLSAQEIPIDSSVVFINHDWIKAQKQALRTGKLVFVHGYKEEHNTSKKMEREVYTNFEVSQFFNAQFINLKLDLEKGVGVDFDKKYKTIEYPALIFLSPEGILIHHAGGFQSPESFLQLGEEVLDPHTQISAYKAAYEAGDRSADFLFRYASTLSLVDDSLSFKIGKMYLDKKDNWASNQALAMVGLLARTYGDPYFNYMVEKRYLFVKDFGEGVVDRKLVQIIKGDLFQDLDALDLEDAKNVFIKTFPSRKAAPLFDRFEIEYWDQKGRQGTYVEKTKAFVKKYSNISWNTLNEFAWEFYEKVSDPKALKWAIKWAKKSISININRFNTDTLAALYYKTGNQKQALKWAKRSIALAEEAGADYQGTTALLEKINKM